MASETTAAADGQVGELRRDLFAMLPFCGYNMGDCFAHWVATGAMTDPAKLPRIYFVNWFRMAAGGRFAWPDYGENSRVLEWIAQRLPGRAEAVAAPIGSLPAQGALGAAGLAISKSDLDVLSADPGTWREEAALIGKYSTTFGRHLPGQLREEHNALLERLNAARDPAPRPQPRPSARPAAGGDARPGRDRGGELATAPAVTVTWAATSGQAA